MNIIEIHGIYSYLYNHMNCDDQGEPKSMIYGGTKRARISSQCQKRAEREEYRKSSKENCFNTRYMPEVFKKELMKQGIKEVEAEKLAGCLSKELTEKKDKNEKKEGGDKKTKDKKTKDKKTKDRNKTKGLFYSSDGEVKNFITGLIKDNPKKDIKKAIESCTQHSKKASEIDLFGRMVCNYPELTIEGVLAVAHAVSTHKVENELDYFTAVDDLQLKQEQGAAHLDNKANNAACFYRYCYMDLDKAKENLSDLTLKEREICLKNLLHVLINATPQGGIRSTAHGGRPSYILGLARQGNPLSLVEAFEIPIQSKGAGYIQPSIKELENEYADTKRMCGKAYANIKEYMCKGSRISSSLGSSEVTSFEDLIEELVKNAV